MSDERIEAAGKAWNLVRRTTNCRLYEFKDEFENILHVHVIRGSPIHGVAMDPRGNLIHASTTGLDGEPIGMSVPATEHSVMCMGTEDGEYETYRRLITETYPTGIVSIVSDTWDFWNTVTNIIPSLKDEIMAREGKVVIRPDSGDPELILCGDNAGSTEHERKGLVECLYDTFGGTVNDKGYKTLDSHIGAIYGDSITTERMGDILRHLELKKFTSDNVVFGVGSFSYQYNTRDTFNFAIKATAGKANGEYREIYKDPKTGDGSKKSARGFIRVDKQDGEYVATYPVSHGESRFGSLASVFTDGRLDVEHSLTDVRRRLREES